MQAEAPDRLYEPGGHALHDAYTAYVPPAQASHAAPNPPAEMRPAAQCWHSEPLTDRSSGLQVIAQDHEEPPPEEVARHMARCDSGEAVPGALTEVMCITTTAPPAANARCGGCTLKLPSEVTSVQAVRAVLARYIRTRSCPSAVTSSICCDEMSTGDGSKLDAPFSVTDPPVQDWLEAAESDRE